MTGRSPWTHISPNSNVARHFCRFNGSARHPSWRIDHRSSTNGAERFYAGASHHRGAVESLSGTRGQPAPIAKTGQSVLRLELAKAAAVINESRVPKEDDLVRSLEICDRLARSISKKVKGLPVEGSPINTPVKNLLSLEDQRNQQAVSLSNSKSWRGSWRTDIEATSLSIIADKNTFITPKLLKIFISTLTVVQRLQNLPAVFDLYASKPIPIRGTSPVSYARPDPTSIKAAIPLEVAQLGLDAAIEARDLALCLNIVSTTVATSAFRRNKVVRKVSVPAFMVFLTPLAAYELAVKYTESAVRSDPDYAFDHSFLAFLTFFTMTSVMGFYAIVQSAEMERVTWRPGTKLHSKWTREEERNFADQIAQAWGFQDDLKRGEEEGKDWKNLRKWLMNRSMDLDRADLMEGME